MEIFQQRFLDVMGPLSRLWKWLEDIKNVPDDVVPVPVEDHMKLIKQTIFLLNQLEGWSLKVWIKNKAADIMFQIELEWSLVGLSET